MSDFIHPDVVAERTTVVYTSDIQDEDGVAIPGASLGTLTLTLYDQASLQVLNGRSAVSVLNANGGTVDSGGNFTMVFDVEDFAFVGTGTQETHVAVFRYTYDTTKAGQQRVFVTVGNEPKVA